jgi:hypothetical protein
MNADTKAVARELVAWFMSGNSVPVDIRHTARVNGERIIADAERLDRSINGTSRSTKSVDRMMP